MLLDGRQNQRLEKIITIHTRLKILCLGKDNRNLKRIKIPVKQITFSHATEYTHAHVCARTRTENRERDRDSRESETQVGKMNSDGQSHVN